jgi:hypothetical protein
MVKPFIFIFFLSFFAKSGNAQADSIALRLAQEQLDAYNKRDIEAFLKPYADSVKVFTYPDKLEFKGKEVMRMSYAGMFAQAKDLHCTLVSRMVLGNKVIDEESVIFQKGQPPMRAIAIYTIDKDKIAEVRFIANR